MRYLLILILSVIAFPLTAQERDELHGLVQGESRVLEGVYVKNITSRKATVTNAAGEFSMQAKSGDTLVFSHLGMQDLIAVLNSSHLKAVFTFKMTSKVTELQEVTVDENEEITAVSVGLPPNKQKKPSMNERRLQTAGDFKPIHLLGLLAGGLPLDPILNAINGRTKKLKHYIEIEKIQKNIAFLEIHYIDYMQKELELSDAQCQLLISEAVANKNLQTLINLDNKPQLQLFLLESWLNLEAKRED